MATHAVALTAAALPTTPYDPYDGPSLFDLIGHGVIIPSLGQAPPTPPPATPIPGTTSANTAIKNIYNVVEPWVRYGFELATYAVGWVPYVGWLSGQIMIFYNFGERITRSITFNVADWLFGPLPFIQGLTNVARDSWNALVQLGIDEWNFFLPPLPPLPPLPLAAARQPAKGAVGTVTQPSPAPTTTKATGHSARQVVKPVTVTAIAPELAAASTNRVATKSPAAKEVPTADSPAKASSTGQSGRTKAQGRAHSNRR
ncbi:hypothetical protein H7J51_16630 [Mycobacterium crocinum]|uniref:PE family protein n=1 Tax=Mycolicibacterium crocinum TaxID=388459 RepID=A0ABY3TL90_9MYCO|nr:hypothetical protein [Mycolicibacterium crocinum]MCV7216901.1 hypothetical protein [Mycolicibacterium crocinum]ULN40163.1 hypothetical protein MI149_21090 [Mycolicibacterium crocinum]